MASPPGLFGACPTRRSQSQWQSTRLVTVPIVMAIVACAVLLPSVTAMHDFRNRDRSLPIRATYRPTKLINKTSPESWANDLIKVEKGKKGWVVTVPTRNTLNHDQLSEAEANGYQIKVNSFHAAESIYGTPLPKQRKRSSRSSSAGRKSKGSSSSTPPKIHYEREAREVDDEFPDLERVDSIADLTPDDPNLVGSLSDVSDVGSLDHRRNEPSLIGLAAKRRPVGPLAEMMKAADEEDFSSIDPEQLKKLSASVVLSGHGKHGRRGSLKYHDEASKDALEYAKRLAAEIRRGEKGLPRYYDNDTIHPLIYGFVKSALMLDYHRDMEFYGADEFDPDELKKTKKETVVLAKDMLLHSGTFTLAVNDIWGKLRKQRDPYFMNVMDTIHTKLHAHAGSATGPNTIRAMIAAVVLVDSSHKVDKIVERAMDCFKTDLDSISIDDGTSPAESGTAMLKDALQKLKSDFSTKETDASTADWLSTISSSAKKKHFTDGPIATATDHWTEDWSVYATIVGDASLGHGAIAAPTGVAPFDTEQTVLVGQLETLHGNIAKNSKGKLSQSDTLAKVEALERKLKAPVLEMLAPPKTSGLTTWDWIRDVSFLNRGDISMEAMEVLVAYRGAVVTDLLAEAKAYAYGILKKYVAGNKLTVERKFQRLAVSAPILERNSLVDVFQNVFQSKVDPDRVLPRILEMAVYEEVANEGKIQTLLQNHMGDSLLMLSKNYLPHVDASSDGSADVDSDIDLPTSGPFAAIVVQKFNQLYRQRYGMESATSTDVNLYAVDGDLFIKISDQMRITMHDRGLVSWNVYRYEKSGILVNPLAMNRFLSAQDIASFLSIRRTIGDKWAAFKSGIQEKFEHIHDTLHLVKKRKAEEGLEDDMLDDEDDDYDAFKMMLKLTEKEIDQRLAASERAYSDMKNKMKLAEERYAELEDNISKFVIKHFAEKTMEGDDRDAAMEVEQMYELLEPMTAAVDKESYRDARLALRKKFCEESPDLYNMAMNRLYEERLDRFREKKLQFDLDVQLLLSGDPEGVNLVIDSLDNIDRPASGETNDKVVAEVVQQMDKRFMTLASDYIEIGYYANEAYITGGALTHVVGNMQGKKDILLFAEPTLHSLNEQYGMLLHGYHHIWEIESPGLRAGKFLFKTGKYLDRLANAYSVLKDVLPDPKTNDEIALEMFQLDTIAEKLSKLGNKLVQIKKTSYTSRILHKRALLSIHEASGFIGKEMLQAKNKKSGESVEDFLARALIEKVEQFVIRVNILSRTFGIGVSIEDVKEEDSIDKWSDGFNERGEQMTEIYRSTVAPLNLKDPVSGDDVYRRLKSNMDSLIHRERPSSQGTSSISSVSSDDRNENLEKLRVQSEEDEKRIDSALERYRVKRVQKFDNQHYDILKNGITKLNMRDRGAMDDFNRVAMACQGWRTVSLNDLKGLGEYAASLSPDKARFMGKVVKTALARMKHGAMVMAPRNPARDQLQDALDDLDMNFKSIDSHGDMVASGAKRSAAEFVSLAMNYFMDEKVGQDDFVFIQEIAEHSGDAAKEALMQRVIEISTMLAMPDPKQAVALCEVLVPPSLV